jgi:hypothetical protein
MGMRGWNVAVLVAVAATWLASGTQRERPVVEDPARAHRVAQLEAEVAANPADAAEVRQLAQAYLDTGASGLAVSVIESAPASTRGDARLEHAYARALVEQGRNQDALAAERSVITACMPDSHGNLTSGCDTWLIASATRRADILKELVNLGVEDAQAQPEASLVAYHNATREARVEIR